MVSILLVAGLGLFPGPQLGLRGQPGCTLPIGGCTRVLFIGNSYTSVNDLPSTFANLAWAAGHRVDTQALDAGGTTLEDHVEDSATATALRSERWNFVVLQDQSQMPALASTRASETDPAAANLVGMVRNQGARPLLYLTFAHQNGWPEMGLPDYTSMQAAIDDGYLEVAGRLGVGVVPVGDAWEAVEEGPSPPQLWQADGSHPTVSGTYLAACVFYAAIFMTSPAGLGYDDGLPAGEAGSLQRVAASTVFGDPERWDLPG
ncbi:MAG TPA: DUF4886 domain-containing protein [Candidatus Binatia bacterium]|nr:DUF4886 domain-containing protein [Candidatus Binatia bacterium]